MGEMLSHPGHLAANPVLVPVMQNYRGTLLAIPGEDPHSAASSVKSRA